MTLYYQVNNECGLKTRKYMFDKYIINYNGGSLNYDIVNVIMELK